MHLVEVQHSAKLLLGAVAVAHINHVILRVLFHHIPRTAAQAEAFALSDGVEPKSIVLAEFFAGFNLNNRSLFHAEMTADEIVVVDLPKEANALTIFAIGIGQVRFLSNAAHFFFG